MTVIVATEVTGPLLGWWVAALVLGLVVAVVVTVLLQTLLTRVREIEEGAEAVWTVGKEVARNTATTWMLGQTADVVEGIHAEALRHDALLRSKGA